MCILYLFDAAVIWTLPLAYLSPIAFFAMSKRFYTKLHHNPIKAKLPSAIRHHIDDKQAREIVKDVSAAASALLKVTKEASVPLPPLQAVVGGLLEVVKVYEVRLIAFPFLASSELRGSRIPQISTLLGTWSARFRNWAKSRKYLMPMASYRLP